MLRARKRFGQHFLERPWVDKVIRAISPQPSDVFLEIGPGRGALTMPLAAASAHVIALEIDRDLARALTESETPRLTVLQGDFLRMTTDMLSDAIERAGEGGRSITSVRVAGNLPYNVAAPILFKLLDLYRGGIALSDLTLMLQREVADRVMASPGSKDYGVLTVLLRHAAETGRLLALPPGAFRPQPKIQSTLIRVRFHQDRPEVASREVFKRVVQTAFGRRRKTLSNALSVLEPDRKALLHVLELAHVDGTRRPESLEVAEFATLANLFAGTTERPPVL